MALTRKEIDDGSQVDFLLDQTDTPVASFTADGAYDQDSVSTAVPSDAAETAPTQRDRHLRFVEPKGSPDIEPKGSPDIAKHGRAAWQKASGHTTRARAEAAIGRFKQVIGHGLRSRTDERRATEVNVAVPTLNRMLDFGRPNPVRVA